MCSYRGESTCPNKHVQLYRIRHSIFTAGTAIPGRIRVRTIFFFLENPIILEYSLGAWLKRAKTMSIIILKYKYHAGFGLNK